MIEIFLTKLQLWLKNVIRFNQIFQKLHYLISILGGLDLSFFPKCDKKAICGYTIFAYEGKKENIKMVFQNTKICLIEIPYKAGYLGFREAQPMIESVKFQLKTKPNLKPDVILVDGNGILHPKTYKMGGVT